MKATTRTCCGTLLNLCCYVRSRRDTAYATLLQDKSNQELQLYCATDVRARHAASSTELAVSHQQLNLSCQRKQTSTRMACSSATTVRISRIISRLLFIVAMTSVASCTAACTSGGYGGCPRRGHYCVMHAGCRSMMMTRPAFSRYDADGRLPRQPP
jgi:hypothetical protein